MNALEPVGLKPAVDRHRLFVALLIGRLGGFLWKPWLMVHVSPIGLWESLAPQIVQKNIGPKTIGPKIIGPSDSPMDLD